MRRRALNFAAILSVAACLGLLVTWLVVRKHPYARPFIVSGRQWEFRVTTAGAELTDNPQVIAERKACQALNAASQSDRATSKKMLATLKDKSPDSPEMNAFFALRIRASDENDKYMAALENLRLPVRHSVPFPALMTISLLPAGIWAVSKWRLLRKHQPGHCRGCGYDIRATPYRCPECGKSVSTWDK